MLFAYRLCLELGIYDIDSILSLGADKLLDWFNYYQCEPFGFDINNTRAGIQLKESKKQTADEQFQIANNICNLVNPLAEGGKLQDGNRKPLSPFNHRR